MALPARTDGALVEWRIDGDNIYLVPHNQEGEAAINALTSTQLAYTTVALTKEDAGRGGYGETNEKYQALKVALS